MIVFRFIVGCTGYSTETDCESVSGCGWSTLLSCQCASDVIMDICFVIDSSDSITSSNFNKQLSWLADFTSSSISTNARVGIIDFAQDSNVLLNFTDANNTSFLQNFILNSVGYYGDSDRNTVSAISQAYSMFKNESNDATLKVIILLTNGNPSMSDGGDIDLCQWAYDLKFNDIRTYIVKGGDSSLDSFAVDCLLYDSTSDIISSNNFTSSELNTLASIDGAACPGTLYFSSASVFLFLLFAFCFLFFVAFDIE